MAGSVLALIIGIAAFAGALNAFTSEKAHV